MHRGATRAGRAMSLYTAFTHLPTARRQSLTREIVSFQEGTLDPFVWPALFQDILEAGALPELPYRFTIAAQHCVDQRLCYYSTRVMQ